MQLKVYQKKNGKTKIDLAIGLLDYAKKLRIKPKFVVFDSWYTASKVFKKVEECQWTFVTQLKKNRKLDGVAVRDIYRNPYWQKQGKLVGGLKVLVVRHGKKYFATNNLSLGKQELFFSYKQRWEIETIF